MKNMIIYLLVILFAGSTAFAQMPPASKPDMQLTKEEATLRIQDYQKKVDELRKKLETATSNVDALKKELDETIAALKDCQDALLALIEATKADVEAFRQKLGVIEGKVRQWKGYENDRLADMRDQVEALENDLNELRKEKLSLLPEFYNKIIALAKDIKGLYREKKIRAYTVGTWSKDRDCLWNIAGKIEIYGDPFQWSKIWQANKDIVRNPDIIHPGQVLTLPAKGPKDTEAKKMERKYWREKREAAEEVEETTGAVAGPGK